VDGAQHTLDQIALANKKNKYVGWKLTDSRENFMSSGGGSFCSSLFQLFSPQYLWSTIPLFAIYFSLAFGCGVFVWMPVLLEEKHLEIMSMYRSMVIMALSQIPGVIVSAWLVEAVGRKFAIGSFFFFGAVSCCVFAVSSRESLVILSSIAMEFFLAGVNGTFFGICDSVHGMRLYCRLCLYLVDVGSLSAYTVEVYPTAMRATAMGACSALSRLSSVINPTLWATLLNFGVDVAIYGGALSLMMGLILLFLLPVETKDDDIRDFASKKKEV